MEAYIVRSSSLFVESARIGESESLGILSSREISFQYLNRCPEDKLTSRMRVHFFSLSMRPVLLFLHFGRFCALIVIRGSTPKYFTIARGRDH